MIAAHLVWQDILWETSGAETPCTEAILNSMHAIQEQMVNSAIGFHYYNVLEESTSDIPL
jgi:Ni,Fe-hydrogenase I small subunit